MTGVESRFATEEEVFSAEFWKINQDLLKINKQFNLADHSEMNQERFSWASKLEGTPLFYAARMWEYPFAILSSGLKQGLKCADIGCGTTPFTPFLSQQVGAENVTGFDPDYIQDEKLDAHPAFGTSQSYIDQIGFNFFPYSMTDLKVPDNSFDRVFCISVLEHIGDPTVQQKGVMEMARILKPGGLLIITVDLGINTPLTSPLDIIKFSGLTPVGNINLRWPKKRFVNYNTGAMDVFGIVLEKSEEQIFLDYEQIKQIPMYKSYDKFVKLSKNFSLPYADVQLAKDTHRSFGIFRVLIKHIMGKYR